MPDHHVASDAPTSGAPGGGPHAGVLVVPVTALLGSVVLLGMVLGVVDAALLHLRPGIAPPAWDDVGRIAVHLAALDGLVGLTVALLAAPVLLLLRGRPGLLRRVPDLIFAVLGLTAVAALGFVLVRRPTWHAVDLRVQLLLVTVGAGAVFLRFWLARPERARLLAGRSLLIGSLLSLGTLWASIASRPQLPPVVVEGIVSATVSGPPLARLLRRHRDRDRDGFPTWLCAADCDCDDAAPRINPAAMDVAGDGVDSDCDGHDPPVASSTGQASSRPPPDLSTHPTPPQLPSPVDGGVAEVPDAGQEADGDLHASDLDPAAVSTGGPARRPPNLLLITVDTLRADHMSSYGYERQTTPNLDRLARDGTLFEQARAQGPMTRFSVASMLTGMYHSELKRTGGKWPRIHDQHRCMAERLKDLGYSTAAVSCHFYFMRRYGLTQGFDVVDLKPAFTRTPFHRHITGDLVTQRGQRLLADLRDKQPFLLWLHYGDPHSDYQRHPSAPQWGRQWKDLYDQEIYYTDEQIALLLGSLREQGLADETVVVVTSDHGEGLVRSEDHGNLFHGQHLYDNLVRVPLIFLGPGVSARRLVQPAVGLVDLLPTFLELAGAPSDPDLRGVSLVPYLRGRSPQRGPVFGERPTDLRPAQLFMLAWPDKLIWDIGTNHYQRFRLDQDPNEETDLFGRAGESDRRLVGQLKAWYGTQMAHIPVVAELQ